MSSPIRSGIPEDYPDRIRNIRKRIKLTQTQFAEFLGVSYASVSRWENGQSRPNNLAWQRILEIGPAAGGDGEAAAPSPSAPAPSGPNPSPDPDAVPQHEILRVSAVLAGNDAEKAAQTARYEILAWAEERTGGKLPSPAWDHEEFEYSGGGGGCAAVRAADKARDIWAIRVDDPGDPDGEAARQVRTTEAIVRHIPGQKALLAVRLMADSPEKELDIRPPVPDLVPRLVSECGLQYRAGQLRANPWIVESDEDADLLIDTLIDPDRQVPVFVLTVSRNAVHPTRPPIDPAPLARENLGIATIAVLPAQFTWKLTNRFGKQLSVFNGALRAYLPGFTEDADPYGGHDLILADRLSTAKGRSQTAAWLRRIAARESRKSRRQERYMRSYADVRTLGLAARRKRLDREGASDSEQLEFVRMQNAQLEKNLAETRKELEHLWNEHGALDERAQAAETQQTASASLIQDLRKRIVALGGNPDPDIELPRTWEEFPDWCDLALAGRVILSPRARREAKAPKFRDVQTAARSLLWLAGDYRDRRLDGGDGDLRTRIENGIHNERCGGDSFPFDWRGERFPVEWHIKNGGNTRKPERCLRIYYFWHEASGQSVVASMPAHLRTGAT